MITMALKRLVWVLSLSMITLLVHAQDAYFVYLQTENNQPFYARMNNKVLSSTLTGYLILPKMQAGQHQLLIGFPKDASGENKFTLDITDASSGYLLKKFEGKGWQLFNLQSMALISPDSQAEFASGATTTTTREDAFSKMLASATRDSALLRKTVRTNPPVEGEKKVESVDTEKSAVAQEKVSQGENRSAAEIAVSTSETTDGVVAKNASDIQEKTPTLPEINKNPEKNKTNAPKRILNVSGRDGNEMIYVDRSKQKSDTIRVFIPSETTARSVIEYTDAAVSDTRPKQEEVVEYTITPTIIKEETKSLPALVERRDSISHAEPEKPVTEKKAESQVFIIRDDTPAKNPSRPQDEIIVLPSVTTTSTNSDCKDFATNNDFLKIRKKMAAEKDRDAMVFAAKKIFKTKCFSTEQILNLSYLFLTDEGRYMFFDAAYPYTSDSEKFPVLISQLKDEYYVNRFQALIQK